MLGHPSKLFISTAKLRLLPEHEESSFMLPLPIELNTFWHKEARSQSWEGSGPGIVEVLNVTCGRMSVGEIVACVRIFISLLYVDTYTIPAAFLVSSQLWFKTEHSTSCSLQRS